MLLRHDMASEIKHIELREGTELQAIADEVQKDGSPRVLERGGQPVAVVVTLKDARHSLLESPSPEGIAAALSAAGAWADLDTDAMIDEIYRARHESPTRVVDF
jgi:hypothetical protein